MSIAETAETVGRLLFNAGLEPQFIEIQPGVATVHTESGLALALLAVRRGWIIESKPDGFDVLADRIRLEVRTSGPHLDIVDEILAEAQQQTVLRPI